MSACLLNSFPLYLYLAAYQHEFPFVLRCILINNIHPSIHQYVALLSAISLCEWWDKATWVVLSRSISQRSVLCITFLLISCASIHLSVCLSVCLFIYLSISCISGCSSLLLLLSVFLIVDLMYHQLLLIVPSPSQCHLFWCPKLCGYVFSQQHRKDTLPT